MEVLLFIGIPAAGKSTFYQERFSSTHVRINRDMLKSEARTRSLFAWCLDHGQSCVLDNTNTTQAKRTPWIAMARMKGIPVTGYFFSSALGPALTRNQLRVGNARIPDAGVRDHRARLEIPNLGEGFDRLYFVRLAEDGFQVEDWKNEI
jgi:predicted kinase